MPEQMGLPKAEEKKDIISGKIAKDGAVLSWKSDAPIEPMIDKPKKETPEVISVQKADNVIKMGDANALRSQKYYRRSQETKEAEIEATRRALRKIPTSSGEYQESAVQ